MSHNVGANTTASPIKFLGSSKFCPLPSWRVFLFSAHWWFLMITGFSSIYCKWKVAQLTGIWVSQGKLRQIKSTSASPVCPATENCYVCGLSGLPHIEDIPVSVLSCPCSSAYVQVCVCTSFLLCCRSPWGFTGQNLLLQHQVLQRASAERRELGCAGLGSAMSCASCSN